MVGVSLWISGDAGEWLLRRWWTTTMIVVVIGGGQRVVYVMKGGKDNPSGGHGVGSGLQGGKTKQVGHAGSGLGRGFSVSKSHGVGNGPSVGAGVGSGRGVDSGLSVGIDPKDANKTTVWRHGSYVKIRPPKGKGRVVTLCTRGGAGSYNLLDSSDSMADLDELLNTTTSLHDAPKDIPNDDDDDLDGYFDDMGDSDEDDFGSYGDDGGSDGEGGGDDGGDGGDADRRELIIPQGKSYVYVTFLSYVAYSCNKYTHMLISSL
ncbi:uncharacterized protein LOC143601504 [Bidens hawaiensis]|uniref:uncharacterized protein LOC143601504 n=1 Tax=Bidens hawaiensis TaxID=980011 RepID=UPI00404959ED